MPMMMEGPTDEELAWMAAQQGPSDEELEWMAMQMEADAGMPPPCAYENAYENAWLAEVEQMAEEMEAGTMVAEETRLTRPVWRSLQEPGRGHTFPPSITDHQIQSAAFRR